jgi:hypothetical protein
LTSSEVWSTTAKRNARGGGIHFQFGRVVAMGRSMRLVVRLLESGS